MKVQAVKFDINVLVDIDTLAPEIDAKMELAQEFSFLQNNPSVLASYLERVARELRGSGPEEDDEEDGGGMAEELTVNLAAELLSHLDGCYNDQYDVFIGVNGNENVVDVTLEDAIDPSVPKRRFRFIGEELNG